MVAFLVRYSLACLLGVGFFSTHPVFAAASLDKSDAVFLDMAQAFAQNDRKKLTQLLPQTRGHVLEPWAAYWELRARLGDAADVEIKEFLNRYAGTYQEDRLRNDWLLVLGQRKDWSQFEREHALYRMQDDKEVACYDAWLESSQKKFVNTKAQEESIRQTWLTQRQADEGCTFAVEQLLLAKRVPPTDIWRKARLMSEFNRKQAAKDAARMVSGQSMNVMDEVFANTTRFLLLRAPSLGKESSEWVTLALVRIAANDFEVAAKQMNGKTGQSLNSEQRQWVWGVIGRQAAMKLDSNPLSYFALAGNGDGLTDEMLAWKARAALRADEKPRWSVVASAIEAMSPSAQKEPVWLYWHARAALARATPTGSSTAQALAALQSIAGPHGFYEQLAEEELGRKIMVPARPPAPTATEMATVKNNPVLQRAVYAIRIGLRQDGVREWNYGTSFVNPQGQKGRWTDREKLAASQWACELEIWDRCINTSERTSPSDVAHRFPTPHQSVVMERAKELRLDPAYIYGLIRQESRFITDARSSVGATGLMQVMPATAKWTAKKSGMKNFQTDQLNSRDTNIAIGTSYLKMVLDNFHGSMPMAAAAYNAGPSRPRKWRNGPVLEGAIWAECVPFSETRDYVKKVMANTTMYAALLTGEPQSLKARLGQIGPRVNSDPPEDGDLP